jgi:hypothetical protein
MSSDDGPPALSTSTLIAVKGRRHILVSLRPSEDPEYSGGLEFDKNEMQFAGR